MPEHTPSNGMAGFDRLLRELRGASGAAPPSTEAGPREVQVTVQVELSDEAAKFIQVAGVSVDELGV